VAVLWAVIFVDVRRAFAGLLYWIHAGSGE
jgi:hypothetical protein